MAIAYRAGTTAGNASGGNLTVNKPSGTAENDILVVVLYREAGTWTLPSGWAQWGSDQRDYNTQLYLTVAWKRAGGSEGASYTFNLSTTTWRIAAMAAFSGCITSGDPIDVGPTGRGTNEDTASVNAPIATSITTATANAMRVMLTANYNGTDVTAGTSSYTAGASLGGCEIWYSVQASAGASGDKTFAGMSGSDRGDWATFHLALKEATSGQTITATGIASAEAFGTDQLNFELFLSAIASGEAFGTQRLDFTLSPSAIASLEAFGTAALNLILALSGITSAEAFGTAVMVPGEVGVSPSAITSAETFGSSAISVDIAPSGIVSTETVNGPQVDLALLPGGLTSAEAFGSTTLTLYLVVTGLSSGEAFGSSVVSVGDVAIVATAIGSAESFGNAQLALALALNGITSAEAFGSAALDLALLASAIATGEMFGSPTLNLVLLPSGIASGEALGNLALQLGLSPTGIASAEVFGTTQIALIILPAGVASAEGFGSVVVSVVVEQSIVAQAIASAEAFGQLIASLAAQVGRITALVSSSNSLAAQHTARSNITIELESAETSAELTMAVAAGSDHATGTIQVELTP